MTSSATLERGQRETRQETFPLTRNENGEVIFYYHQPFDRISCEYDEFSGTFPRAEFERGKHDLKTQGSCKIAGYNCTLDMIGQDSSIHLIFSLKNKAISLTIKSLDELE